MPECQDYSILQRTDTRDLYYNSYYYYFYYKKSVAVVRKQTIPTERPSLDGEVSAGREGVAW
jgi:hypothetical protein